MSHLILLFSAQLKIDDEAEHYCRVHSPTRRRKVVQDKVKTGMEKLNTLKMIEKDVEDGVVKERANVRLTRSASVKMTSSSSLTTKQGRNMTNGMHPHTASKTEPSKINRQHLAKKVTFKSNLEEEKCKTTLREVEVAASQAKQIIAESLKSNVTKRSSSLPRWSIERPPSPLRQHADALASPAQTRVPRKTACTPPRTRKVFANKSKPCTDELKTDAKNDTVAAPVKETDNTEQSDQNPSHDKSGGSKSPGGVPCKVIANDKTRGKTPKT